MFFPHGNNCPVMFGWTASRGKDSRSSPPKLFLLMICSYLAAARRIPCKIVTLSHDLYSQISWPKWPHKVHFRMQRASCWQLPQLRWWCLRFDLQAWWKGRFPKEWQSVLWRRDQWWFTVWFVRPWIGGPIFTACSPVPQGSVERGRPPPHDYRAARERTRFWGRGSQGRWRFCWRCLVRIFRKWASGSRCNFIFAASWSRIPASFTKFPAGGKEKVHPKGSIYLKLKVDYGESMRDKKRDIDRRFFLDNSWKFILSFSSISNFHE